MTYEKVKALAAETGKPVRDLLALSPRRDPFYAGAPSQLRDAEWFAKVFEQYARGSGTHLRRVHYVLVSLPQPVVMSNGKPYINTDECWSCLTEASVFARYLGLVNPAAFIDRRNPEPHIYSGSRELSGPVWDLSTGEWELPSFEVSLECRLRLPDVLIGGYDYDSKDQRYHLAVFIEKSTQNDILEPLCREYGMDLITGVGFQSISTVVAMLRHRVAVYRKPVRIFYVSDFDPAGVHMPPATARQFEKWIPLFAPGAEVKLTHLALTRKQVTHYALPRIPIKERDRRRENFELRHGEGAVELDALQALYPGELARIVREAVSPYFDPEHEEALEEADSEATESADEQWEAATAAERAELEAIRAEAESVAATFRNPAGELARKWKIAMRPVEKRLETLRHSVQAKEAEFQPVLPARPEPEFADAEESGWLFDSGRDYEEQIVYYLDHRDGNPPCR